MIQTRFWRLGRVPCEPTIIGSILNFRLHSFLCSLVGPFHSTGFITSFFYNFLSVGKMSIWDSLFISPCLRLSTSSSDYHYYHSYEKKNRKDINYFKHILWKYDLQDLGDQDTSQTAFLYCLGFDMISWKRFLCSFHLLDLITTVFLKWLPPRHREPRLAFF